MQCNSAAACFQAHTHTHTLCASPHSQHFVFSPHTQPHLQKAGCDHITCRCGCEFCYECGAMYISGEPGCNCPLYPQARRGQGDEDGSDGDGDGYVDADSNSDAE